MICPVVCVLLLSLLLRQAMADDTEDVELDFAADEQERARRSAVIRCSAGEAISHVSQTLLFFCS